MSEWKGPWKCEKCGRVFGDWWQHHNPIAGYSSDTRCPGNLIPYDRRSPDARDKEIARLREALESIAKNTCCDRCQEAAIVARAALASPAKEGTQTDEMPRSVSPLLALVREAVKYAEHRAGCNLDETSNPPCTCGLDDFLRRAREVGA